MEQIMYIPIYQHIGAHGDHFTHTPFSFLHAKGGNACYFGCFFQNTRPKNRKTYFSISFSESTLQCGHFAPLFTRIGSRSSEIETKTYFSTSPCMVFVNIEFSFFERRKKSKTMHGEVEKTVLVSISELREPILMISGAK